MKKYLLIILGIFLLTGCAGEEEITCRISGKEAIFTLKNGMISHYKVNGMPKTNAEIAEINGTFFTSSETNEDAIKILHNYVESLGGSCD